MHATALIHAGAAALAVIALSAAAPPPAPTVRSLEIAYVAHDGVTSHATVILPASYDGGTSLPLVISPHGRGLNGETNARLWGDLPARGFAVVNPDGAGDHLSGRFSWGAAGQVDDLARMPDIVEQQVPGLRIDRTRIYAVGGSMGGQETLLLVARYPHLLAGAVAVDPTVDFARQYDNFGRFECSAACMRGWGGNIGDKLQSFARREVGGSPADDPSGYAARSPLSYTTQIAESGVRLELWWSTEDKVILDSRLQSGLLADRIREVPEHAPLHEVVGTWRHTHPLRYDRELPEMLADVGL
jgi:dipeptidyl aminopeptidase/acylaminoacyl peptidase